MLTLQDLRDVIREEMGSNVNVTHESETPSASQHVLAKLAGKEVVFGLAGIRKKVFMFNLAYEKPTLF
jgi:hypothetical protein